MWSVVVIGAHPIEADQEVWLEVSADDVPMGPLRALLATEPPELELSIIELEGDEL